MCSDEKSCNFKFNLTYIFEYLDFNNSKKEDGKLMKMQFQQSET